MSTMLYISNILLIIWPPQKNWCKKREGGRLRDFPQDVTKKNVLECRHIILIFLKILNNVCGIRKYNVEMKEVRMLMNKE